MILECLPRSTRWTCARKNLAMKAFSPIHVRIRSSPFSSYDRWTSFPLRSKRYSFLLPATLVSFIGFTIVGGIAVSNGPRRLESAEEQEGKGWAGRSVKVPYSSVSKPLTVQQVEGLLQWDQQSIPLRQGSSMLRFDASKVASNFPIEDHSNLVVASNMDGNLAFLMTGIYDGHAGWQTSDALQTHLISYVLHALMEETPIGKSLEMHQLDSDIVDSAITRAFNALDDEIMTRAAGALSGARYLNEALNALEPAYSGSCALFSYYNEFSKLLKVACVGDSRAVLGRRVKRGKWQAVALSADQTGYNADEVSRLQQEHPGETDMIKGGRVLGMAVTRAFGDSRWKWGRETQESARDRFFGPEIREPLKTPPYLTADPVITTTKIQPEKQDFIILASDGLWDRMTNEEAVDLVGKWLETHDVTKAAPPPNLAKMPAVEDRGPVDGQLRTNPAGARKYNSLYRYDRKNTIVKDENAATHLIRNALGGADEDLLCGMLSARSPFSRDLRDDITVQVVFFGDGSNGVIRPFRS